MKKNAYKTPKDGTFRTYFHGNRRTNGCTFRMFRVQFMRVKIVVIGETLIHILQVYGEQNATDNKK